MGRRGQEKAFSFVICHFSYISHSLLFTILNNDSLKLRVMRSVPQCGSGGSSVAIPLSVSDQEPMTHRYRIVVLTS